MANILSHIKSYTGEFVLDQRIKKLKRNKRVINLNEAKAVGIVYNVSDQRVFNTIKGLVKELTTQKRQVMAIGYVDRNSIPNYCIAANSGYYFNQRDLNWYGGPKNDYIKEFINKEFDILIDLNLYDEYALRYISGLSRSKFKVGSYSKTHEKYFDMMIDFKSVSKIEEFIEQVLYYLLVLNRK